MKCQIITSKKKNYKIIFKILSVDFFYSACKVLTLNRVSSFNLIIVRRIRGSHSLHEKQLR